MKDTSVMDPVVETIKTYNAIAEDYKKRHLATNDKNVMQPSLDEFLSRVKTDNPVVLDIGSGAGYDAKYLHEHNCRVTSIDLSDSFLEIAKDLVPDVEFLKMDVRNLSFKDSHFDGIWASASLLHLPKKDMLLVLMKINTVLKGDGGLFIAVKQGAGEEFVVNKGKEDLDGARRFFAFYSKTEFEELLNKAGFVIDKYGENQNRKNIWMNFFCSKK